VVSESGEDGTTAVLRYLPVYNGTYVVDAKSGDLINVDALYENLKDSRDMEGYGAATAETAADSAAGTVLTEAELEGIEKLSGVLGEDELDAAVRALTAIGVTDDYTRGTVDYNLNRETGDVTASLTYWVRVEEAAQAGLSDAQYKELQAAGYDPYIRKYVAVDAKTGLLQSLYTSYSGFNWDAAGSEAEAAALPAAAEDFISSWHGTEFAQTARYSAVRTSDGTLVRDHYVYARTVDSYFFPDNQITVSVNQNTGYIDELSMNWTEDISFGDSMGLISEDAALAAYADAFQAQLHYQNLPVEVDPNDPVFEPYLDLGYSYVYRMALVYSLESEASIRGIDAKTGEVLFYQNSDEMALSYSDIAGTYAQDEIEELASYGVGYYGGAFKPYALLTQRDMILLLVSAQGYKFDPADLDEDYLYSVAYNLGILDASERDPEAVMTRAGLVKTLVKMSGYGKAAELPGIYVCGFADDKYIPADLYGYIAIGKGLGIVSGYADNTFRPERATTRMEGAVMLYNFMDRNR
jgi:hypothetical protein